MFMLVYGSDSDTRECDALVVGISSDMSLPNILKPLFLHHNTHATLEISSEVEK